METTFDHSLDLTQSAPHDYFKAPTQEPDPDVWAAAPYDVIPSARPEDGSKATYVLTLDENLIQSLLDARTPLYNSSPRHIIKDRRIATARAPPRNAIAGIKPITKVVDDDFYEPLWETLREHPRFGEAKASWQASDPPNVAQQWRSAQHFCTSLKSGLFSALGAILKFLPEDRNFAIADGGDQDQCGICITATAPQTSARKRKAQGNPPEVVMVVELMPWLLPEDIKHIIEATEIPSAGPSMELSYHWRVSDETCHTALQRLAFRMRATNAPVGCIYTGSELVVFEREFKHDMAQWRKLSQVVGAVPRGKKRSAPGADNVSSTAADGTHNSATGANAMFTPTVALTVQLRPWSVVFTHPLAPHRLFEKHRTDNLATCLAALVLHAHAQMNTRPKALGDGKRKDLIQRYLQQKGHCPCSTGLSQLSGQPQGTAGGVGSPSSSMPPPTGVVDMLQKVRLATTSSIHHSENAASGASPPPRIGTEKLVAIGRLTCSPRFAMPYLLVGSTGDASTGYYYVGFSARLYIVTEAQAATAAYAALLAANVVVEPKEDAALQDETSLLPDNIYCANPHAADELLRSLEMAYRPRKLLQQDVVIKLPNIVENSADSIPSVWAQQEDLPAEPSPAADKVLCICPLGLCEAVCLNCNLPTHGHDLAALERQADKIDAAGVVERCALRTLTQRDGPEETEVPRLLRKLRYSNLVLVHLAFRWSTEAWSASWPALAPILDRWWAVRLDAGVALADIVQYAKARAAMPSELDNLSWSPRRLRTAEEVFDYLVVDPRRPELVASSAERQLEWLYDRCLMLRQANSKHVYVNFYSVRALELFASQPVFGLQQDPDDDGEKRLAHPLVSLMNLSSCGYMGPPEELEEVDELWAAGQEGVSLPSRKEMFPDEEDEELDPYADLPHVYHDVRVDTGGFVRTWIQPSLKHAAPSVAPSVDSADRKVQIGPKLAPRYF